MNTIKYPMSRLQIFNACRAVAGISHREFAQSLNPPVTVPALAQVLQGRSKSKRIEKALNEFIALNSRAVNLSPQHINSLIQGVKINKSISSKKGAFRGKRKNSRTEA